MELSHVSWRKSWELLNHWHNFFISPGRESTFLCCCGVRNSLLMPHLWRIAFQELAWGNKLVFFSMGVLEQSSSRNSKGALAKSRFFFLRLFCSELSLCLQQMWGGVSRPGSDISVCMHLINDANYYEHKKQKPLWTLRHFTCYLPSLSLIGFTVLRI